MLESGFRISDLQNIPVHKTDCQLKNKIALDNTFILSYSHTVYGINYNRQNYKIPLNSLRDDLKGYIGVESLVAPWSEQLKLWHGFWDHEGDRNKSYTYVWNAGEANHLHYNPDKFKDLENSYYIIKDTPFPFETEELNNRDRGEKASSEISEGTAYSNNSINTPIQNEDPYPNSNKIVTKSYIDERLAGKRLIEVETDFYVRDYDCVYIIRASELQKSGFDRKIKVHFPESYNERSLHNRLNFTILVEGKKDGEIWVPAIADETIWEFYDFNGDIINPTWLNDGANTPPSITDQYLYANARYLVFRVETTTAEIKAVPIYETSDAGDIITSYNTTAVYDVSILCENLLYRNTGIERVNGIEGTYLDIISSNNTANIDTRLDGAKITVDVKTDIQSADNSVNIVAPTTTRPYWNLSVDIPDSTDIKSTDNTVTVTKPSGNIPYWNLSVDIPEPPQPRIKKLPAEINLLEANGNVYWTDTPNPVINFGNAYSIEDKVITFKLLYYVTEDSTTIRSAHIDWAMSDKDQKPTFIKDRLYMITITNFCYHNNSPFKTITAFGRIDYYVPAATIEWDPLI